MQCDLALRGILRRATGASRGRKRRWPIDSRFSRAQKSEQQFGDFCGLLLLHPMPGAVQKMDAGHTGAGDAVHLFDRAWALVDAPIAAARDEDRRYVDSLAGIKLQLGFEHAAGARAIPVEPALKPVAPVFAGINRELLVGQPSAVGDLARRRHLL